MTAAGKAGWRACSLWAELAPYWPAILLPKRLNGAAGRFAAVHRWIGRGTLSVKPGPPNELKFVDACHFLAATACECNVHVNNDRRVRSSHGILVMKTGEIEA